VLSCSRSRLPSRRFEEADLESLKKRLLGNLLREQESTAEQARLRFSQLAYPEGHPNYTPPFDRQRADVKRLTCSQLAEFHVRCYGRGSLLVVATGDVDHSRLAEALLSGFGDWRPVQLDKPPEDRLRGHRDRPAVQEVVAVPDKSSVDLILGLVTPIHREHPDFLPLYLGSYILGGNFAARLMTTVRDEAGLTYGIGSGLGGAGEGKDAFWITSGTFAPALLEAGRAATMEQITRWAESGVTAEELAAKKTTITGTFKVGLATTRGMAAAMLDVIERGRELDYLDEYPREIMGLTLAAVNRAISKYIQPDNLLAVAAGSLDDQGRPQSEH
jgi:zinc protease